MIRVPPCRSEQAGAPLLNDRGEVIGLLCVSDQAPATRGGFAVSTYALTPLPQGGAGGSPRETPEGAHRGEHPLGQPTMRCVVQNDVRSVVVAACAAALNSAVVDTPYQCEVA